MNFYEVVVLLDFGLEPIDDLAVLKFFEFTQTPVEVVPANLERFREVVREVVGSIPPAHCRAQPDDRAGLIILTRAAG